MKHSFHFEVLEALGEPGCAFCRLGGRTASRYLDILAYENVNNVELRATIREAIGLCNRHAWQLLDGTRAPLGTAIIYRDLIRTIQKRTNGDLGTADAPAQRLRGLLPRGRCVACAALDEMIHDCGHQVLQSWSDRAFRQAFEASDGLCWPHLLATLDADRLARRWPEILAAQRVAWDRRIARALQSGRAEPLREALSAATRLNGMQMEIDPKGSPPTRGGDGIAVPRVDPGQCPVCASVEAWLADENGPRPLSLGGDCQGEGVLCPRSAQSVLPESEGLLCAVHAWHASRTARADDAATLARQMGRLYDRLLRAVAADTSGPMVLRWAERYRRGSGVPPEVRAGLGCPTCLAQVPQEVAVVARIERATLCVPHLRLAASHSTAFAAIRAQTRQTWHDVEQQLDEYIRKHDYRFQREPRGEEQGSPRWAVALVAGAEGVR